MAGGSFDCSPQSTNTMWYSPNYWPWQSVPPHCCHCGRTFGASWPTYTPWITYNTNQATVTAGGTTSPNQCATTLGCDCG